MDFEKIYTKERCERVGGWLERIVPDLLSDELISGVYRRNLQFAQTIPQLMRIGLGREGYFVTQYIPLHFNDENPEPTELGLVDASGVPKLEEDVKWDLHKDEDGRHALFLVVDQYLTPN